MGLCVVKVGKNTKNNEISLIFPLDKLLNGHIISLELRYVNSRSLKG